MLSARKAMILEDEPDFREVLVRHLRQGHDRWEVIGAGSLEEAIPALSEGEWDLILSDLTLPGTSGEDLLLALRQLQPRAALVVVTGRTEEEMALRALGLGAQEYLFKGGLTGEMLRRASRLALERKRIERELSTRASCSPRPWTASPPASGSWTSRATSWPPTPPGANSRESCPTWPGRRWA